MPEKFRHFCQTLSVNGDPLDLFVDSLLLDMFSLGIPLLRGGVGFLIFHKVSFEKHSSEGMHILENGKEKNSPPMINNLRTLLSQNVLFNGFLAF